MNALFALKTHFVKKVTIAFAVFALISMPFAAQAEEEKPIKPIALEIAANLASSNDFVESLSNSTQIVVGKVREVFPALTPEAAEAFASNYLDLVIEKIAPEQARIQAKVFSELMSDDELARLKEMSSTPEGASVLYKFTTAMRVQGVLVGRETNKLQQVVFDEAVEKTIAQGHKMSYAKQ